MIEKTFNFTIKASSEKTCKEAMQAAADIVKSLSHADLLFLADLAKKKPEFVQKAKPYVKML